MVGYDPNKKLLTKFGYGMAGAGSGIITRMLCQPLDVLKIRFQLQVEPIEKKSSSKYSGLIQATSKIFRDEHMPAFWKGHMPAQMLSMVYGTVQFGSFELLTKYTSYYLPIYFTKDLKPISHFTCGCMSGCMATVAAQPFDVIRTRFIAQGTKKKYRGIWNATHTITKTEGFFGLYRGLLPTLLQIAPQAGFQFAFYTICQNTVNYINATDFKLPVMFQSFLCGAGAGICAKTAIYPLDMLKKRLQIQGFEHGRVGFGKNEYYTGFVDCVQTVVRKEGILALYKGLSPSLWKAMISVGMHFSIYDYICRTLVKSDVFTIH